MLYRAYVENGYYFYLFIYPSIRVYYVFLHYFDRWTYSEINLFGLPSGTAILEGIIHNYYNQGFIAIDDILLGPCITSKNAVDYVIHFIQPIAKTEIKSRAILKPYLLEIMFGLLYTVRPRKKRNQELSMFYPNLITIIIDK